MPIKSDTFILDWLLSMEKKDQIILVSEKAPADELAE